MQLPGINPQRLHAREHHPRFPRTQHLLPHRRTKYIPPHLARRDDAEPVIVPQQGHGGGDTSFEDAEDGFRGVRF